MTNSSHPTSLNNGVPASSKITTAGRPQLRRSTKVLASVLVTAGLVIGGSLPATAAPATAPAAVQQAGIVKAETPMYPATGGTKRFVDVKKSDSTYKAITWMYQAGLTSGTRTSKGVAFKPTKPLTRQALAAVLYRQAGSPSYKMPRKKFYDVKRSHSYYKPITWMKAKGYASGSKTRKGAKFSPSSRLTRQATAAMLYRVEGRPSYSAASGRFVDVKKSHQYYKAIMWAKSAGIIGGYNTSKGLAFKPTKTMSRQSLALTLHRLAGKPEFVDSGSVKIQGAVMVGETVTAAPSGWKPANITYTYQWYLNGAPIAGATTATYALTAAEEGGHLQVRVSGSLPNAKTIRMTTASIRVLGLQVLPGTAKVSGKAEVGQTLTAATAAWYPATTVLSYEWLRGGAPIPGATAATFPLVDTDLGSSISVRVTGSLTDYQPAVVTSKAVTVVPKRMTNEEATEIVRQSIFTEVNRLRVQYGLNALEMAPQYATGANGDSTRQLNNYLNTGVAAGHVPRISYWQGFGITDPSEAPYDVLGAAGAQSPQQLGKDIVASWMASPGHCWWVLRESTTHMYPGVALMGDSDFNPGGDGGFAASMLAFRHDVTWDSKPGYNDQDPSWPANQVCR